MKSQIRLSVCMIVRDEEQMLADCLASVQGVADQIVVLDTGSTDRTVEIAEAAGAEVHHFKWIDDFAAARNESLKYAQGNWILWLDADELLEESSVNELRKLVKKPVAKPTIYRVYIKNLQPDKKSITLSSSFRLISHHPQIKFTGRVHEQVHEGLQEAGGIAINSSISLYHYGYALEADDLNAKLVRNRSLLEAMVTELPDSAYAHFTLGQNRAISGDYAAALTCYERAIELDEFTGSSLAPLLNAAGDTCWHLNYLDRAEQFASESIKLAEIQISGYFILYSVEKSRENIQEQIKYLELILAQTRSLGNNPGDLPQDIRLPEIHILYSLGELYGAAENFDKAAAMLGACINIDPSQVEAMELWMEALAQLGRWDEIATASQFQSLSHPSRNMIGTALIKLERFPEAISFYKDWLAEFPDLQEVRKRLAALYAKTGDLESATKIIGG